MIRAEIDRRYGGRNCDGICDGLDAICIVSASTQKIDYYPISIVSATAVLIDSAELVAGKVNLHNKQWAVSINLSTPTTPTISKGTHRCY